jgi:hypothetical protein
MTFCANPGCRQAFSLPPRFETNFSDFATRCLRETKPVKMPANCLSGLFQSDGGLKSRLQARLPAPPGGRLHAMKGQSPELA